MRTSILVAAVCTISLYQRLVIAADDAAFRVWVPSGPSDPAKEQANKQLVMDWLDGFWGNREFDQWQKWMAPDFRNHDAREPPVGAQALVDWLRAQMAKHPDRAPKRGQPPSAHMFFLAAGDLVVTLSSPGTRDHYDAGEQVMGIAGNVIRVKDGKIAEWWFVGGEPAPAPAADQPPPPSNGPTGTAR